MKPISLPCRFSLVNLLLCITIFGLSLGWWVDRKKMSMRVDHVRKAAAIGSQADWLTFHFSDVAKTNDRYLAILTLIGLVAEKESLEEARGLEDIYSAKWYAANLLQALGVDSADDYFESVDKELKTGPFKGLPDIRLDKNVSTYREIHESEEFREFIEESIKLAKSW
jgi:hypothetical protein